jgi:hypothetical protein
MKVCIRVGAEGWAGEYESTRLRYAKRSSTVRVKTTAFSANAIISECLGIYQSLHITVDWVGDPSLWMVGIDEVIIVCDESVLYKTMLDPSGMDYRQIEFMGSKRCR